MGLLEFFLVRVRRGLRLLLRNLLECCEIVAHFLVLLNKLLMVLFSELKSFNFRIQVINNLLQVVILSLQSLVCFLFFAAVSSVLLFFIFELFERRCLLDQLTLHVAVILSGQL